MVATKKVKSTKKITRKVGRPRKVKEVVEKIEVCVDQPRDEHSVREEVSQWCKKTHPKVEVQKKEYQKLLKRTGKKKVIDATLIGHYPKPDKWGSF